MGSIFACGLLVQFQLDGSRMASASDINELGRISFFIIIKNRPEVCL